jgi:hypothetical protein
MNLTTHLLVVPRTRMVGLYLHPIRLYGVKLNSLSTGTTLPLYLDESGVAQSIWWLGYRLTPGEGRYFFLVHIIWSPHNIPCNRYGRLSGRSTMLSTHLHIVLKVKKQWSCTCINRPRLEVGCRADPLHHPSSRCIIERKLYDILK